MGSQIGYKELSKMEVILNLQQRCAIEKYDNHLVLSAITTWWAYFPQNSDMNDCHHWVRAWLHGVFMVIPSREVAVLNEIDFLIRVASVREHG